MSSVGLLDLPSELFQAILLKTLLAYIRDPKSTLKTVLLYVSSALVLEDEDTSRYEEYVRVLTKEVLTRAWGGRKTILGICLGRFPRGDLYIFEGQRIEKGHTKYAMGEYGDHDKEYDLLAAAAWTNKVDLVRRLSCKSQNLQVRDGTFGNPYFAAIMSEHWDVLDILYANIPKRRKRTIQRAVLTKKLTRSCSSAALARFIEGCDWRYTPCERWHFYTVLSTPKVDNIDVILAHLQSSPSTTRSTRTRLSSPSRPTPSTGRSLRPCPSSSSRNLSSSSCGQPHNRIKKTPKISTPKLTEFFHTSCYFGWERAARHWLDLGAPMDKRAWDHLLRASARTSSRPA
ncbi:hypothetical protein M011DRAFT_530301 [Sporormia fimetaria CBS 119925]|uniref:Ankyrin n=1 Tax=Sporormia fimetaria CBS 119925 TaxID=1340428 RepID=A0A6A6UU25_9PLEO|nr:hypothetical protein M011DRAFT_530301 [Sporormia fimetaria CBS 119925]